MSSNGNDRAPCDDNRGDDDGLCPPPKVVAEDRSEIGTGGGRPRAPANRRDDADEEDLSSPESGPMLRKRRPHPVAAKGRPGRGKGSRRGALPRNGTDASETEAIASGSGSGSDDTSSATSGARCIHSDTSVDRLCDTVSLEDDRKLAPARHRKLAQRAGALSIARDAMLCVEELHISEWVTRLTARAVRYLQREGKQTLCMRHLVQSAAVECNGMRLVPMPACHDRRARPPISVRRFLYRFLHSLRRTSDSKFIGASFSAQCALDYIFFAVADHIGAETARAVRDDPGLRTIRAKDLITIGLESFHVHDNDEDDDDEDGSRDRVDFSSDGRDSGMEDDERASGNDGEGDQESASESHDTQDGSDGEGDQESASESHDTQDGSDTPASETSWLDDSMQEPLTLPFARMRRFLAGRGANVSAEAVHALFEYMSDVMNAIIRQAATVTAKHDRTTIKVPHIAEAIGTDASLRALARAYRLCIPTPSARIDWLGVTELPEQTAPGAPRRHHDKLRALIAKAHRLQQSKYLLTLPRSTVENMVRHASSLIDVGTPIKMTPSFLINVHFLVEHLTIGALRAGAWHMHHAGRMRLKRADVIMAYEMAELCHATDAQWWSTEE